MRGQFPAEMPWKRFREFIAPNADRFTILNEILKQTGLEYSVVTIAGNRHFFLAPQPSNGDVRRRMTILTSHYDRAPGSPGANDNSAAVFIMMETAAKLIKNNIKNWLIIFTDKEELQDGEGFCDQGSYTLAAGMKDSGLVNSQIFNFDACGIGDTIIISTTAEYLLKNDNSKGSEKLRSSVKKLRDNALETARKLNIAKVLLAPTPFSDDAGFLRAGMAAQTITVLPTEESALLVSTLRKNPEFAKSIVNQQLRNSGNSMLIPQTWRSLNSPRDSHIHLTPQHFHNVLCFAEGLCKG